MFTIDQTALLDRIMSFPIDGDEPASLPFVARLADENGWRRPYAERVVREYKRFLFLSMAAGHPVTPSDAVDQAWHLHLTYTRSYWERLCRDVLPHPLHHDPTRGGANESAKFHDWYTRTLESYRRLFDEIPPADIWPAPTRRFVRNERFQRVNRAQHFLIPKRRIKRAAAGAALMVISLSAIGASGDTGFMAMLWFGGLAFIVFITLAWRFSNRSPASGTQRRRQDGSSSTNTGSCGALHSCSAGTHASAQSAASHATSMPAEAGDAGAGGDAGCGASSGCGGSGCGGGGCGGGGCGS